MTRRFFTLRRARHFAIAAAALAWCSIAPGVRAQSLSYNSGQNISPAFEGWEQDPDGKKYFLFGYMNRNWQEEIDVPVGPDNSFDKGGADQGQPTHFMPRRNRFVFRVPVPANFTEKDELIWTLTTKGKTEKAYATIRTDYMVDDVVKASETGALGAGTSSPEVRANKPPVVKVDGARKLTARVGEPLTIVTAVTDDGIPKPRGAGLSGAAVANPGSRRDTTATAAAAPTSADPIRPNRAMAPPFRVTVGKNVGLHLSWFVYRGAGKVTFDPQQIKAWEDTRTGANSPWAPIWIAPAMPADGKITVRATFDAPGTYVLKGVADDGALLGSDEVTVTVTP
jgi:autonomous glycyl radical cofactor GrcA